MAKEKKEVEVVEISKKEQLEQMLAKFEWIHLEKDAVRAIFESLFR